MRINRIGRDLAVSGLVSVLAVASFQADAATVPDAYSNLNCDTTAPVVQTCDRSSGGFIIHQQTDLGTLTATARVDSNQTLFVGYATATVTYAFALNSSSGPVAAIAVPIDVHGHLDVENGGSFNANSAYAAIEISNTPGFFLSCIGTCSQSSDINGQVSIVGDPQGTNIYTVNVTAQAQSNSNIAGNYSYAHADPTITIDPAFLALHPEYSLSFSPNLPNVPVPPAAPLLASGLGWLGLAGRRRA